MNKDCSVHENLLLRTFIIAIMLLAAAALRLAPHPWNFTPVGAMALFAGAKVGNRWLAMLMPLLVLFAGDLFIGFHRLIPIVYGSFLLSVAIGRYVADRRSAPALSVATLLGATQFFLITNFAVWALGTTYPLT